jgi:hypothetical protein
MYEGGEDEENGQVNLGDEELEGQKSDNDSSDDEFDLDADDDEADEKR